MIADQPFDGFAFLRRQAKARGNLPRDLRAKDRMILGPPLADVVQEQRDVKHPPVHPFIEDLR